MNTSEHSSAFSELAKGSEPLDTPKQEQSEQKIKEPLKEEPIVRFWIEDPNCAIEYPILI